jgi:hypothetical protein
VIGHEVYSSAYGNLSDRQEIASRISAQHQRDISESEIKVEDKTTPRRAKKLLYNSPREMA